MYTTILLAAALQNWDRYSTHALAAREVAATLAKGASHHLHVLSVYDDPPLDTGDIPAEIATRHRDDLLRRTDTLMVEKMDEYVAPLKAEGLEVTPILRSGNPRDVIVQVATSMQADLLILGSHSKRGLLDIALDFLLGFSGRATAGEIGGVRRIVGASVFNDDEKSVGLHFFKPACLRILSNVLGAKSSLALPPMVTRPGFVACLNWRWPPRDLT